MVMYVVDRKCGHEHVCLMYKTVFVVIVGVLFCHG